MTSERTETRPLDILGISAAEEDAYDWLLTHTGATVAELARALMLKSGKAQRVLDVIEAQGLVTHAPERPRRYIPVAPDIALKALMRQRQESLQRAEAAIQKLQERAATARRQGEQEQVVELITSREAEAQALKQMQRAAQREFVALMRSPTRVTRLDVPAEQDARTQREAQSRGVRYRSIVDREYMNLPGAVARMRSDANAGEKTRIFPELPLKLVIADRRIAIIPLKLQQVDSPSLVVRSSALLDALYALFEMIWERAAPISWARGELQVGDSGSRWTQETDDLISLMAAGLNDKKIADELGISMRTLRRRITELTKRLNTRTRFQTAWVAALRLTNQGSN